MAGVADDELAALRARAYGPDADIDDDPEALARLRELERREALTHGTGDDATDPEDPPQDLGGTRTRPLPDPRPSPAPHRATPERPDAPDPERQQHERQPARPDAAPTRPAPRRPQRVEIPGRIRTLWVLSLIIVAAIAAAVTAWTMPFGVREDQHHDARLTALDERVSPVLAERLGAATISEVQSYGEYYGLAIYSTQYCLHVIFNRERGSVFTDCAGGGLAPLVDVYIPGADAAGTSSARSDYPEELALHAPDGMVIRFERKGDVVLVDEGNVPGRP